MLDEPEMVDIDRGILRNAFASSFVTNGRSSKETMFLDTVNRAEGRRVNKGDRNLDQNGKNLNN
jgi:hypothetical protein